MLKSGKHMCADVLIAMILLQSEPWNIKNQRFTSLVHTADTSCHLKCKNMQEKKKNNHLIYNYMSARHQF